MRNASHSIFWKDLLERRVVARARHFYWRRLISSDELVGQCAARRHQLIVGLQNIS